MKINLTKASDTPLTDWERETLRNADRANVKPGALPWYPLAGHREGLRANDPVTLHSAFLILAHEGGTVHRGADLYETRCNSTKGGNGPCYCPVHERDDDSQWADQWDF